MQGMDNIVGQTRAVDTLLTALAAERMHHGLIFHGPKGVGKYTTALVLAKLLLCHDRQLDLTGKPSTCEQCDSCKLLNSEDGSHPDLHIVHKDQAAHSTIATLRNRKRTNIPVDLLREQVVGGTTSDGKYHDPPAAKSPVMNHNKVFVIDEAELMAMQGQNALLKTLEEPSPGTFFVLVSSSDSKLLPTIRSRCQRVAFGTLDDSVIARWLADAGHDLDDQNEQWLLRFAAGSLGRAELIMANDLLQWCAEVLPEIDQMTKGRYSTSLGADIAKMMDDYAAAQVAADKGASKEAANHEASNLMLHMIGQHARWQIRQLADKGNSEEMVESWLAVIDSLRQIEGELRSNVNMKVCAEHLVSLMARALAARAAVG